MCTNENKQYSDMIYDYYTTSIPCSGLRFMIFYMILVSSKNRSLLAGNKWGWDWFIYVIIFDIFVGAKPEHPPWIPVIVPKIQTYLCLLTTKHHIQVFPMLLSMSFVHFVFVYMLTSPFLEQIWWIFFFQISTAKNWWWFLFQDIVMKCD